MTTIADKNTEYSVDFGQIYLDTSPEIEKLNAPDAGAFICFQINQGGNIQVSPETNQRGSSNGVRFDTKEIADGNRTASAGIITQCENLDGTESKATIETLFKDWYNEQEYIERPVVNDRTTL